VASLHKQQIKEVKVTEKFKNRNQMNESNESMNE
jgi:hypothetical protein